MFEVQLKNYEKVQESWEMNDEEKINQANICKEKGTKRFKEQQFKIACGHYSRVIELLTNQETNVSFYFFASPFYLMRTECFFVNRHLILQKNIYSGSAFFSRLN